MFYGNFFFFINYYFFIILFIDCQYVVENLALESSISVHQSCVNSLYWNDAGNKLLSAGDDGILGISDPYKQTNEFRYKTRQKSILCAKFLNNHIISCGFDGSVLVLGKLMHYFIIIHLFYYVFVIV